MKILIPGELPAMNDIIEAAKSHPMAYKTMKQNYTEIVGWSALKQSRVNSKVDVTVTWYCKNRKKDKDNIMAGQKFIFDGLKEAGVIGNDGWKQIGDITHKFEIDKKNPRVEVELKEVS